MHKHIISGVAAVAVIAGAFLLYPQYKEKKMTPLKQTDPEFAALWENFTGKDVIPHGKLDKKTRHLAVLAAHIATQSVNEYKLMLAQALEDAVSAVEAKEVVYQAVPYAGMAKVYDFISATNEVLADKGYALPAEGQSTTTPDNRLEKGIAVQSGIFGKDHIEKMRQNAPQELRHIQNYLSANCFGDYYTRTGLDIPTRELLTFTVLVAMGGAEPQAKAHAQANLNVGNDKQKLLDTVTQILPYIGYPRSLNAINIINEVSED